VVSKLSRVAVFANLTSPSYSQVLKETKLGTFAVTNRARIIDLTAKNRLPAVYPSTPYAEAGGLMSYGPDIVDNNRRAAVYVDKILKGTKPAELPVQQPMKFEFVINLNTTKQIGVTIPPNLLARADKVIR
jgi:putative ABC transport system substrate-binding protein